MTSQKGNPFHLTPGPKRREETAACETAGDEVEKGRDSVAGAARYDEEAPDAVLC